MIGFAQAYASVGKNDHIVSYANLGQWHRPGYVCCLDSENMQAQMAVGERSFKLHVNHLFNKIQVPVQRQLTVEALAAIAALFRDKDSMYIDGVLSTDTLIEHPVKLSSQKVHPKANNSCEPDDFLVRQYFYHLPAHKFANYYLDALIKLVDKNKQIPIEKEAEYDLGG